jgi:tryptophanyl-tRNA synthetase
MPFSYRIIRPQSKHLRATDPGTVEGNPVFIYHEAFNPDLAEVEELKERYRNGKVGDVEVKNRLIKVINNFLEPFREKRAYYFAHPKLAQDILTHGIRRMQTEARETMGLVRSMTGMAYTRDLFADEIDLFGEYEEAGS